MPENIACGILIPRWSFVGPLFTFGASKEAAQVLALHALSSEKCAEDKTKQANYHHSGYGAHPMCWQDSVNNRPKPAFVDA